MSVSEEYCWYSLLHPKYRPAKSQQETMTITIKNLVNTEKRFKVSKSLQQSKNVTILTNGTANPTGPLVETARPINNQDSKK